MPRRARDGQRPGCLTCFSSLIHELAIIVNVLYHRGSLSASTRSQWPTSWVRLPCPELRLRAPLCSAHPAPLTPVRPAARSRSRCGWRWLTQQILYYQDPSRLYSSPPPCSDGRQRGGRRERGVGEDGRPLRPAFLYSNITLSRQLTEVLCCSNGRRRGRRRKRGIGMDGHSGARPCRRNASGRAGAAAAGAAVIVGFL